MALTQTLTQLRANVRKCADIEGTSALDRHPDADVSDYVNRGIGALYRLLTRCIPDQRFLSSSTIALVAGTSTYALPADFDRLVSVDLTSNGTKQWLDAYQMQERPELTNPSSTYQGTPVVYRLRGANIEFLPTPSGSGSQSSTIWYVPAASQLSSGSDTFDTVARLDDFVIWYAAREVFTKDRQRDMASDMTARMQEIRGDIMVLARSRDMNATPRVTDVVMPNRFGLSGGTAKRRTMWRQ